MVILGLNPGEACLDFQGRDGIFANEIRARGSYSDWAAAGPYLGEQWSLAKGRNRFGWNRLRFAREWFEDHELAPGQLLTLELYPWHSKPVTASMAPPVDILEDFIWQPLVEIEVELRVCVRQGMAGHLRSLVPEGGRALGT